jgi:hypothetical protein
MNHNFGLSVIRCHNGTCDFGAVEKWFNGLF